jgi:hypothetical protein
MPEAITSPNSIIQFSFDGANAANDVSSPEGFPFNLTRKDDGPKEHIGARVYVVVSSGTPARVKIGFSTNPDARLISLSSGHPDDLKIIRTIPGGRLTEASFHSRFANYRIKGEWFLFHPEMMEFVPTIDDPDARAETENERLAKDARTRETIKCLSSVLFKDSIHTLRISGVYEDLSDEQKRLLSATEIVRCLGVIINEFETVFGFSRFDAIETLDEIALKIYAPEAVSYRDLLATFHDGLFTLLENKDSPVAVEHHVAELLSMIDDADALPQAA